MPFCAEESKFGLQTLKAGAVSVPILTNVLFPHYSSHRTVRWSHIMHTHRPTYTTHTAEEKDDFALFIFRFHLCL